MATTQIGTSVKVCLPVIDGDYITTAFSRGPSTLKTEDVLGECGAIATRLTQDKWDNISFSLVPKLNHDQDYLTDFPEGSYCNVAGNVSGVTLTDYYVESATQTGNHGAWKIDVKLVDLGI